MSTITIEKDLYLGEKELNTIISSLKGNSDNTLDSIISSLGIIRKESDLNFDNFKVIQGTNVGSIKIPVESKAISKVGGSYQLIKKSIEDNIIFSFSLSDVYNHPINNGIK